MTPNTRVLAAGFVTDQIPFALCHTARPFQHVLLRLVRKRSQGTPQTLLHIVPAFRIYHTGLEGGVTVFALKNGLVERRDDGVSAEHAYVPLGKLVHGGVLGGVEKVLGL